MNKFNRVLIIPIITLIVGAGILVFVQRNKPAVTGTNEEQTTRVLDQPFAFANKKLLTELALTKAYSPRTEDKIYKIDPYNIYFPSQILAKSLAKKLDLNQSDENTWNGTNASVSFIKSEKENYIRISFTDETPIEIVQESLKSEAEEKLKTLSLWPFSDKEFSAEANIFESPNLNGTKATVTFSEMINSSVVITDSKGQREIYVEFDKDGKIKEIVYFYVPYKAENFEVSELKNSEETKTSVEGGKFTQLDSPESFNAFEILNIENAYFTSTYSDYIQPVLLLNGKSEFEDDLQLLVPGFTNDKY